MLGVHDLMVHDYGPGHQFASLHIEFPAEADPLEAHDIIDNIERDFLKKDHLQVTIHYRPHRDVGRRRRRPAEAV